MTAWETNQNTMKKQYQVLTFAIDALIHLKNNNCFCKNVHFPQVTDTGNIFSWDDGTAKIHLHTGINRALQSRSVYTIRMIFNYTSLLTIKILRTYHDCLQYSILIILYRLMMKKQRSLFCDPDDLISVTQQVKCLISVCHSHLSGLNLCNSSVFCRKDCFTINRWNVNINIMRNITYNSVICVPAHLIHMNESLSAFWRAWCPADHCNRCVRAGKLINKTFDFFSISLYNLYYLSFYSFSYWPLLFHGLIRTSSLTKNTVKTRLTFCYRKTFLFTTKNSV